MDQQEPSPEFLITPMSDGSSHGILLMFLMIFMVLVRSQSPLPVTIIHHAAGAAGMFPSSCHPCHPWAVPSRRAKGLYLAVATLVMSRRHVPFPRRDWSIQELLPGPRYHV